MKNIITYTLLVFKSIAAAVFVFIVFVFILDAYQKRERDKILEEEQIEDSYEYIIGTWSKFKSCGDKDKRLNDLKGVRFDEHRNCELSYSDHSEFGTYSLDLDSVYIEIVPEVFKANPKRYSYELTTIYEPLYTELDFMVIASGPDSSVEFKKIK